jgi:hypothetical protein
MKKDAPAEQLPVRREHLEGVGVVFPPLVHAAYRDVEIVYARRGAVHVDIDNVGFARECTAGCKSQASE